MQLFIDDESCTFVFVYLAFFLRRVYERRGIINNGPRAESTLGDFTQLSRPGPEKEKKKVPDGPRPEMWR
jgi:hypothetical protein